MAAYRRVYDSRQLQADCQKPGSAPEPYARQSSMGYLYLYLYLYVPGRRHNGTGRQFCRRRSPETDTSDIQ